MVEITGKCFSAALSTTQCIYNNLQTRETTSASAFVTGAADIPEGRGRATFGGLSIVDYVANCGEEALAKEKHSDDEGCGNTQSPPPVPW